MKPDLPAQAGNPLPQTKIGEDGAEMVLIPAGEFLMGTQESAIEQLVAEFARYNTRPKIQRDWLVDETPQHRVYLDAYYIDKYEVTNAQYKKFIEATGHREPSEWNNAQFNQPNQPVVGASWDDALEYAKWAGKTLPTEAQWEKAARGQYRFSVLYPWGDAWPPPLNAGNFFDAHIEGYSDGYAYTAPVGSFSPNGYGLYDMAGNVLEWCLDAYETDYYHKSPSRNPVKNIDMDVRVFRVVRGGGWSSLNAELRCAYRGRDIPSAKYNLLGFRCAKWVTPPPPAQETIQETKNLGALQLSTNPPGATVYIDGLPYGKTGQKPLQIVFDTGERGERSIEVKLELDGYATKIARVPIRRQKLVRWENVALTPLSRAEGGKRKAEGEEPESQKARKPENQTTTHHSPLTTQMVLISAGEFLMGSSEGFEREKPPHTVYLDAYYIDKREVTNAQYQQFMQATGHPAPAYWTQAPPGMKDFPIGVENPDHPVVGVSFDDALKYAAWAGKTLPTEAQWEKAARGDLFGKKYPLGDTLTHDDANFLSTGGLDKWIYSAPVASFPPNNFGLYDMVGNVWEWCLDAYEPDYYSKSPKQNPVNQKFTATKKHAIRGGAWQMNLLYLSCSYRDGASGKSPYIGFRCVTLPEH